MNIPIKHLDNKFVDDQTYPAQLIARGVKQCTDFGIFQRKKGFCDVTFSRTSRGVKSFLLWPGTNVPSLVQIQKGVPYFQKKIHYILKNVLLAVPFQDSVLRMPKITNTATLLNFTNFTLGILQYSITTFVQYENEGLPDYIPIMQESEIGVTVNLM